MLFNLIVAICNGGGIGYKNKLPWHYKDDLKFFSKITKGKGNNAIIMGRKTWDSLPIHPLPNRFNIILSKTIQNVPTSDNIIYLSCMDDVYKFCESKNFDACWIIGGKTIYDMYLNEPYIHKIYISEISKFYDCDTFFPKIPEHYICDSNQNIYTGNDGTTINVVEYYNSKNKNFTTF
tara:strand:+ start:193 stop:726 length:534 start_codon:yes stop_codon:yes gene_type:complete